jgi:predicted ABC-type sugar transport system permease subunit
MKKGDVAAVTPNAIFYNIIPFVVYMVVAVVLWWKADRLSDSLIPNQSEVMQDARWDYHAIQTLIFSGIGLYALVDSLPGLGRALYRRHLLAAQTTIHLPVNLDERAFLFQASLEVVLGVGMLLGARGLSQTLLWIRELGLRSKG